MIFTKTNLKLVEKVVYFNEVNQSVIHESLNNFEKNGKSDIKR